MLRVTSAFPSLRSSGASSPPSGPGSLQPARIRLPLLPPRRLRPSVGRTCVPLRSPHWFIGGYSRSRILQARKTPMGDPNGRGLRHFKRLFSGKPPVPLRAPYEWKYSSPGRAHFPHFTRSRSLLSSFRSPRPHQRGQLRRTDESLWPPIKSHPFLRGRFP